MLQGQDWKNQTELERQFEQAVEEINAVAVNPWDRVDVALGFANYNPANDKSMESVFRRADVLMYENKKRMKEARQRKTACHC